ncbi:MAG: GAF domain-containing protein [Chloroflexota bacterium]
MMSKNIPEPVEGDPRQSLLFAAITIAIALFTLAGWSSGMRFLAGQWGPYIPMAPSTALAFLLVGGALFCSVRWSNQRWSRFAALTAAGLVLLLGLLILTQFITGIDPGLEQALFRVNESFGQIPLGRMSPLTAGSFLLESAALLIFLLAEHRWPHAPTAVVILAAVAIAINITVLTGYAYGAPLLYGGTTIPTAFPTALAFVSAGIGLVRLTIRRSPMLQAWGRATLRGRLLRAFLPLFMLFILLDGWLDSRINQIPVNPALWHSLLTLLSGVLIVAFTGWIARHTGDTIEHAQEELKKSEEKFRTVADFTYDWEYWTDPNGRMVYVSPSCERISGRRAEEFLADEHLLYKIVYSDDLPMVQKHDSDKLGRDGPTGMDFRILTPNGEIRWINHICQPVHGIDGRFLGRRAANRDVTERVLAEMQVLRMKRLYATLSQVNQTIVRVKDQEDLYRSICNVAVKFGEFSLAWVGLLDETTGDVQPVAANGLDVTDWPFERVNIHQGPFNDGLIAAALRTLRVVTSEDLQTEENPQSLRDPNRRIIYHSSAAIPIRFRGKAFGILSLASQQVGLFQDEDEVRLLEEMGLDISFALDTMQAEQERQRAEAEIQSLAKFPGENPNPILRLDSDGVILYANPASDLLLQDWGCGAGERAPLFWQQKVSEALASRKSMTVDMACGDIIYSFFVAPVLEAGYVNLYGRDITGRKQAEDALRENEAFTKAVLDHLPIGIAVNSVDPTVTFNYMNDNFPKYYRTSREKLAIPDAFWEAVYEEPEFREEIKERVLEDAASGDPERMVWVDVPITRRGEETRYISARNTPIPGKPLMISAVWDVTERKRAEEMLERRVTELEALHQSGLAFSQTFDPQDIGEKVIEVLSGRLNWHHAAVRVRRGEGDEVELVASSIPSSEHGSGESRLQLAVSRVGEGLAGWVIQHGQPLRVDNLEEDPRYVETFAGMKSGLYVPMRTRDETIGCISAESGRPNAFSEEDERMLMTLAGQAAIAIHNAELFRDMQDELARRKQAEEKNRQQLARLTALWEIDQAIASSFDSGPSLNILLSQALNLLNVDAATVLKNNTGMNTLEYAAGLGFKTNAAKTASIKLGESYAGRAALERRMVRIPDLSKDPNNVLLTRLLKGEGFVQYYGTPLVVKGKVIGVLEVFSRSVIERDREWFDFFNMLAGQAAIAMDSSHMFADLQRSNIELAVAYDATIEGWSHALDLRDKETEGHTQRVTETTLRLAEVMGFDPQERVQVRRGALLHDIGKLGVPDAVLLKPGALTEEEWVIMRRHPEYAYEMIQPIEYLRPALDIPYCHHEKWDGTGYPRGLAGERIPLAARIFAVVDVWDALRSDRPYRPAWPIEKARAYIQEQAGKHFDPNVVSTFLKLFGRE